MILRLSVTLDIYIFYACLVEQFVASVTSVAIIFQFCIIKTNPCGIASREDLQTDGDVGRFCECQFNGILFGMVGL